MSSKVYREMNAAELQAELLGLKQEQLSLRMQRSVNQRAEKSHLFCKVRRNIARIKTILADKKGNDE
jgi:large subunit ribosomal protein L29